MRLYLFSFNNYYNRIIKKFDTIEEYGNPLEIIENINFNPNDGLNAEQLIMMVQLFQIMLSLLIIMKLLADGLL